MVNCMEEKAIPISKKDEGYIELHVKVNIRL